MEINWVKYVVCDYCNVKISYSELSLEQVCFDMPPKDWHLKLKEEKLIHICADCVKQEKRFAHFDSLKCHYHIVGE